MTPEQQQKFVRELAREVARPGLGNCAPDEAWEHDLAIFEPLLTAKLAPLFALVEAGQALSNELTGQYHGGDYAEKCDACKANKDWDAALANLQEALKP
jgi:hypothetical protein